MAISQRTRVLVLDRDGHRCRFCGATAEQERLEVDHIQPRSDGGTDSLDNLATLCRRCNAGKSDLWFGDYMQEQIARDVQPPPRRSAFYPTVEYQTRAIDQLISLMDVEGVRSFSAFDFATAIATTPRDGVQPFFEPLTAATCREAIDGLLASGRLSYSSETDLFALHSRRPGRRATVAEDYDPFALRPDDYDPFDPHR